MHHTVHMTWCSSTRPKNNPEQDIISYVSTERVDISDSDSEKVSGHDMHIKHEKT
jgi:hypothetical protein